MIPLEEWIKNWLVYLQRQGNGEMTKIFIATLRDLWTHRSEVIFRNAKPSPLGIMLKSKGREMLDAPRSGKVDTSRPQRKKGPCQEQLIGKQCPDRVSIATNNKEGSDRGEWRISDKGVDVARGSVVNHGMTNVQLELTSLVEALQWAWRNGHYHITVETMNKRSFNELINSDMRNSLGNFLGEAVRK